MKANSLEYIFRTLNDAGVRYLVAGGLAVVAHGYVRLTMDVDLIIGMDEDNLRRAMSAFRQMGYRPRAPVPIEDFANERVRRRWIAEKQLVVFQLVSDQYPTEPMDVFAEEPFDFNTALAQAAHYAISDTVSIPVVQLRDLILLKERANRPKDQVDIMYLKKLVQESDEA